MDIDVYIPLNDRTLIDPGSGIVGTLDGVPEGRMLVDFEGNRFGSVNLRTYADRVHHAAGRQKDRYPTIARAWLDPADFVRVGTFNDETGDIDLLGADEDPAQAIARIATWCSLTVEEASGQLSTTGGRHQMLREVRAAMASHDPARRFAAQQMARRYKLNV